MNVIIGICGGIAAYKTPQLVRLFAQNGDTVQCVATEHATQFVTPLTLETVSKRPLYSDLFAQNNAHSTEHISLKEWGDILVVAPATANIMAKMACGIADDALSTLLLSFSSKPIFVCPAMNTQMLEAAATQENIATLRRRGVNIVESESGELACGAVGAGRMAEPETIYQKVDVWRQQPLRGQRYLVTAGPTYERIDAVRFVGNYSSGKMGYAVAEELAQRGADVELVSGPTHLTTQHQRVHCTRIENAREMLEAAVTAFGSCHGAILTAAVADYRPATCANTKLKKQGDNGMTIEMVQNPDILATLGSAKRDDQILVGFALETNDEEQNAAKKLTKKNLNFIVLNSLRDKGAGFGVDTNKVTIMHRDGTMKRGELKSKHDVARDIVDEIITLQQKGHDSGEQHNK